VVTDCGWKPAPSRVSGSRRATQGVSSSAAVVSVSRPFGDRCPAVVSERAKLCQDAMSSGREDGSDMTKPRDAVGEQSNDGERFAASPEVDTSWPGCDRQAGVDCYHVARWFGAATGGCLAANRFRGQGPVSSRYQFGSAKFNTAQAAATKGHSVGSLSVGVVATRAGGGRGFIRT